MDNAVDLKTVLQSTWDIVLSDFNMPQFNGEEALKIIRLKYPHLPFILVTGAISEEHAVAIIKAGAQDYIHKDKLIHLLPALKRELRTAVGVNSPFI